LHTAELRDAEQWDAIVDSHPEGRFCQLWGYRHSLEEAYGLKCVYLKIQDGDACVGIFPSVKHPRKPYLLSLPFNEYGGPLCRVQNYGALAPLLLKHAAMEGCRSICIRGGLGCETLADSKYCTRHLLQSYGKMPLTSAEAVWKDSLTHKARTSVKQAWNCGLSSETRVGMHAVEGEFYDLYLRSMKRLSVPPHSPKFFQFLAMGLGERLVATWVWHNKDLAAVLVGGVASRQVHCIIIASNERYWPSRPNDLANWQMVEWASGQGFRSIDWGSASTPDELRFKQKWGAALLPYAHYIIYDPACAGEVLPCNRRHTVAKLLWRKLVPLKMTRILGPVLRRELF
jgi:hypothetical protein